MSVSYPTPGERRLITIFIMAGAVMNQIDTTIANVALPHIQGSTSASREQITWMLTSYIVAAAIMTPLSGWLAGRFGRKRLLMTSIVTFTIASVLCGLATNLEQLILFRIFQGISGASLVPMAQATLLDINPPEQHGKAMAIFGMAAVVGPLMGPLLGGWITENLNWRWVFLINVPFGVVSWIGLLSFMPESHKDRTARLDFLGFGLIAVALGALQLMLDRGQLLDWFESTEICIELGLTILCVYLYAAHAFTSKSPFVSPAVFADRNFILCSIVGFFLGVMIYSPMSLLPTMMASLFGYPVFEIGLSLAPRGLGVAMTMFVVARLINRIDYRLMVFVGLLFSSSTQYLLAQLNLDSSGWPIILSGILQGIGSSMIFVPLTTMAFLTLPARYRNEGSALNSLSRNFGAAVGIAMVQVLTTRNEAVVQSRLTESLRPDNPAFAMARPDFDFGLTEAAARLDAEVTRQALMVAYVDSFWLLMVIGLISSLLVWFVKAPKRQA